MTVGIRQIIEQHHFIPHRVYPGGPRAFAPRISRQTWNRSSGGAYFHRVDPNIADLSIPP